MIAHGLAEIQQLAAAGEIADEEPVAGWAIARWDLGQAERALAVSAYRAVVAADSAEWDEVADALAANGVDVAELFFETTATDAAVAKTVRGDVGELVAGALTLRLDANQPDDLFLQNIPKGSLAKSESGLDIALVLFDHEATAAELEPHESLVLGSAKHTMTDLGQLRRSLVASVSTEWSQPYIAQQLRVLHARLKSEDRHVRPERLFRLLECELGGEQLPINAVALIDSDRRDDFEDELAKLANAGGDFQRFAVVTVPSLAELHEACLA